MTAKKRGMGKKKNNYLRGSAGGKGRLSLSIIYSSVVNACIISLYNVWLSHVERKERNIKRGLIRRLATGYLLSSKLASELASWLAGWLKATTSTEKRLESSGVFHHRFSTPLVAGRS